MDYPISKTGSPSGSQSAMRALGHLRNIPMGFLELEETGEGLFWQIEHNGSWHCEIFLVLAVWRLRSGDGCLQIPLSHYKACELDVTIGYPEAGDCEWKWNAASGVLSVYLQKPESARLFSLLVRK
ncbi:hypothetical protein J2T14_001139 [Paenibacillus harenae]|nr:hypothetical protein [Paenibacillus harenae]